MADETSVNGVESFVDPTMNGISKKDRDLEKYNEVSDMERKIDALEEEKLTLLRENEKQSERIKIMTVEIDEFKKSEVEMEERLEQMQVEMDRWEDDKKALKVIAARASELETEVFRLQHDFQSSMAECEDALAENREMTKAYEELRRSNREKDANIINLEKEKDSLMEQMEKSKANVRIQIQYLEEEAKTFVSDLEKLEKEKAEMKSLISYLEEKLKQSEEKSKETEKVVKELKQNNSELEEKMMAFVAEKEEMGNRIVEMEKELEKEEAIEDSVDEGRGVRFPWPVAAAAASTGTIAAAVAMIYLRNARERLCF